VELAKEFGKEVFSEFSVSAALDKAKSLAGPNDLIVVTGSLFVIGEIKEIYA
jgi:folylpolyglutamate synthase/dihydropteroate synthase